jgi:hypothetical protein
MNKLVPTDIKKLWCLLHWRSRQKSIFEQFLIELSTPRKYFYRVLGPVL